MRNRLAMSAAAGVLAVSTTLVASGTAEADSDSYTQHGVEIGTYNYGTAPYAYICNHQSSTNSFYFAVWAPDPPGGNDWVTIMDSQGRTKYGWVTTPALTPGSCAVYSFTTFVGQTVQVVAKSGSLWFFGTNPVFYSFDPQ
ncbi:hypothetical protein AB0L06_30995 [Spirillospora sp. NPDC052269]